jgi:DNA-directed RNA polymerase subunit RPC12/RpoP
MTKDKTKYECAHCGERFVKMHDHMSHVIEQHDTGYKPHGQRLMRKVTCWRCNGEMNVPNFDAGEWWNCDCGFELPRNWVNGQLVPDENGEIK